MAPQQKYKMLPDNTDLLRHPGWETTSNTDGCINGYHIFFSYNTLTYIKNKLDELLKDIIERPIKVTDNVIRNVMENIYIHNAPQAIGDIYSRYHMAGSDLDCKRTFDVNKMVQEVIEVIYDYIKNEYEMAKCNRDMTPWNALYGTFNEHGLLAHPPIKLREKRPQPMQFNMRY
jgi:hypothetical protein